jgi:hypothetical protein
VDKKSRPKWQFFNYQTFANVFENYREILRRKTQEFQTISSITGISIYLASRIFNLYFLVLLHILSMTQ